ncbi:MAG: hypothetical protein JWN26_572 [Candidatus Saccharibacteria bacterium]|nr:hypothetical protein [Candidatus Saccharibacteria bacterium]
MKSNRPSIDGFVPRRIGSQLGELHGNSHIKAGVQPIDRSLHTGNDEIKNPVGVARPGQAIGRSDIDESLREIDSLEPTKKLSKRQVRRLKKQAGQRDKKKRSRTWRIIKWVLILAVIVAVGIAGYTAFQTFIAGGKIFKGNLFDILTQTNQPLKQDSNGRTNILVLGTSEDDPGHQAGNLTDSMMILSIDQTNKNAYMISIPRDLYVQYGQACDAGYAGKINVYYSCVTDGTSVDAQRAALTKTASFVGNIFGLDVQYGVNVNYTVFRDVVNALGGTITVTINSRDPQGQMDSNFDWKCGASYSTRLKNCPPDGHYIQYTNGQHVIDAEHALYLAQARGDTAPTYGFEQSNFDREKNQQMIIKAVRDKAASVGLFTDVSKINTVISSLGDNLRTTFAANEVKTLVSLAQNIKDSNINSISLIDGTTPIMTTGSINGQSSVFPAAGTYDYSALQAYIKKSLSSDPVTREGAPVAVYNGSGVAGLAQTEANTLTSDGFTVSTIASTPAAGYAKYELYQVGTGNSATKAKLEKLLGVTTKTTALPISVSSTAKFVVIIGTQPTTTTH